MKRFSVLVALVVCFCMADGRGAGADKEKDKKELDGLWIVFKREVGGKEVDVGNDALFIEEGVSWGTDKKGTAVATNKAKVAIDPSKDPKTIDFHYAMGTHINKKRLGIYKRDGDDLVMAVGDIGGDKRPGKFASRLVAGPTRAAEVLTYKRAKE